MTAYALRRLAATLPLLLGVTVLLFGVIHLAPGGPEGGLLRSGRAADPAALEAYRDRLGVDDPVPVQYGRWLGAAVTGDLGVSFATGRPVAEMIGQRLPATVELMGAAFLLAGILALVLGTVSAMRPFTWVDRAAAGIGFGGLAMPVFWSALLAQLVFGVWLGWLPLSGIRDVTAAGGTVGPGALAARLPYLVLPAGVLAFRFLAGWSRYLRSSLLAEFRQDYVRTARAKGLPERRVVAGHVFRNALIPLLSVVALDLAALVSGAVITETVFAWPGLGRMFVTAMFARDYPVLMGLLLLGSAAVLVANLAADVAYGWLDPRIRYGAR